MSFLDDVLAQLAAIDDPAERVRAAGEVNTQAAKAAIRRVRARAAVEDAERVGYRKHAKQMTADKLAKRWNVTPSLVWELLRQGRELREQEESQP